MNPRNPVLIIKAPTLTPQLRANSVLSHDFGKPLMEQEDKWEFPKIWDPNIVP